MVRMVQRPAHQQHLSWENMKPAAAVPEPLSLMSAELRKRLLGGESVRRGGAERDPQPMPTFRDDRRTTLEWRRA